MYFGKVPITPYLISDKFFTNANSVTLLDDWIYVTDNKKGLFVIKYYMDDNPFDAPDQINIGTVQDLRGFAVLRSSATYLVMGAITLLSLIATSLF